jgi:hypothetical protein
MGDVKKPEVGKVYVAVRGIDFAKERIEPGEEIPSGTNPKVVADLLANGDIKESE